MNLYRSFLPSISLLAAFESVYRTGSTLAAARDLDMTQGAVSRLIQNLEAQLGMELFRRVRRRLTPTEAACIYARDITKALNIIRASSIRLRSSIGKSTISLSVLPTIGASWLLPFLSDFTSRYPKIGLHIGLRAAPFDFDEEIFDAAIDFDTVNWFGVKSVKLFDERLILVCAPKFLQQNPVSSLQSITRMPLLQSQERPHIWDLWFEQNKILLRPYEGMSFDQSTLMIDAALQGIGIALLPEYTARPFLKEGYLVEIFTTPFNSGRSYQLLWPEKDRPEDSGETPFDLFRDWLLESVQNQHTPSGDTQVNNAPVKDEALSLHSSLQHESNEIHKLLEKPLD